MEAVALTIALWFVPDPLAALQRFPNADQAYRACEFGDAHITWLLTARSIYGYEYGGDTALIWDTERFDAFNPLLAEARRRRLIWGTLAAAHMWSSVEYKAKALDELRERLGDEDFFWGRMPEPVPLYAWRELQQYPIIPLCPKKVVGLRSTIWW